MHGEGSTKPEQHPVSWHGGRRVLAAVPVDPAAALGAVPSPDQPPAVNSAWTPTMCPLHQGRWTVFPQPEGGH